MIFSANQHPLIHSVIFYFIVGAVLALSQVLLSLRSILRRGYLTTYKFGKWIRVAE